MQVYEMKLHRLFSVVTILLLSPAIQATVLDFEGFSAGTIIDNEYFASEGVTIDGVNLKYNPATTYSLATVFDSNNYTGGDSDLAAPFSNPNLGSLSPGKILIIHERLSECNGVTCTDPDDEGSRPAGYFDIFFSQAVTLLSIDFFDIETLEDGSTSDNAILLYDVNGLINTFYTPDTGGDNTWDQVVFNVSGVTSMRINLGGSGAIDNIVFVPEPMTAALMGIGLLMMLFLRRSTIRIENQDHSNNHIIYN